MAVEERFKQGVGKKSQPGGYVPHLSKTSWLSGTQDGHVHEMSSTLSDSMSADPPYTTQRCCFQHVNQQTIYMLMCHFHLCAYKAVDHLCCSWKSLPFFLMTHTSPIPLPVLAISSTLAFLPIIQFLPKGGLFTAQAISCFWWFQLCLESKDSSTCFWPKSHLLASAQQPAANVTVPLNRYLTSTSDSEPGRWSLLPSLRPLLPVLSDTTIS